MCARMPTVSHITVLLSADHFKLVAVVSKAVVLFSEVHLII